MKKNLYFILIALFLALSSVGYAGTVTKGLIGEQDLNSWDGVTGTFTRSSSTGGTLTLNKFGTEVDALVKYGGGVNYNSTTINAALTAIGTTNKATLVLRPGSWVMNANITVTSNITLKIPAGAAITTTGYTLTINGPFQGSDGCFAGTGSVTGLKYAEPEYWTVTGTNDEVPILKAIAAVSSTTTGASTQNVTSVVPSAAVGLRAKRYNIYATVTVPTYIEFGGQGKHNTILTSYITDGTPILKLATDTTTRPFYNTLKSFSIDGRSQDCQGISIYQAHRWVVRDVFVGETLREGIYFYEAYLGDLYGVTVRECGGASYAAVELTGPSVNLGSHAINWWGGEIINQSGIGAKFTYALASGLHGVTVENCGGIGVDIGSAATSTSIDSKCWFEHNKIHIRASGSSQKITNNFLSTVDSDTLTGVTGDITAGTAALAVNDATNLAIGQYISIAGVTGIKLITNVVGATVTIHDNADVTVTGAAVTKTNPAIVLNDVTSPVITGNYFPNVATDIMPYDSTSTCVRGSIHGNHAFGSKTQIVIDPMLKTGTNFIVGMDTDNTPLLTGTTAIERPALVVPATSYVDSATAIGNYEIYLVTGYEPTGTNTSATGVKAIVSRHGTSTIVTTLSAGTNVTLSCDSGTTAYKFRFSNATGSTKYFNGSILRLR